MKINVQTFLRLIVTGLIILTFVLLVNGENWKDDRYLPGFEEMTIIQPDDYSGPVVTTIVRDTIEHKDAPGILYIHGYNDYFFQKEMADSLALAGYNFYAVDLRKYGRSLQPSQTPYEARRISEYFPDIDSAINIMKENGIHRIVLMGHSTGGLIAASYMNHNPSNAVKAVVLNSPFLEFNMSGFMRKVAIPVVSWIGGWWPRLSISQGSESAYAESLLKQYHGEWQFDTQLKTVKPRKVTAAWIRTIYTAQRELHKHSTIKVPVLVMFSDNSVKGSKWTMEHQKGDAVLNVHDIAQYGLKLGPDVTEVSVAGGMHDLMLSAPAVRSQAIGIVLKWLKTLSAL